MPLDFVSVVVRTYAVDLVITAVAQRTSGNAVYVEVTNLPLHVFRRHTLCLGLLQGMNSLLNF